MSTRSADDDCCWAELWDDAHEDYLPCEADPGRGSALGLCSEHEAEVMAGIRTIRRAPIDSLAPPSPDGAGFQPSRYVCRPR